MAALDERRLFCNLKYTTVIDRRYNYDATDVPILILILILILISNPVTDDYD